MAVSKKKVAPASKKKAAKKTPVKKAASKAKALPARAPASPKPVSKAAPASKVSKAVKKAVVKTPAKPSLVKKKTAPVSAKKTAAKKTSPTKPLETVNSNASLSHQETYPQRESILLHSYEPTIDEGADPGHFPTDEVLDETDQAQHLQLQEQAAISLKARELNKPETHPDFDGIHCVECDEVIPKERLSLRKVRCVHCQTFLEEDRQRQRRLVG